MPIKALAFVVSKRIPVWHIPSASISSIPCANPIQIFSGSAPDPSALSDFEPNIKLLRINLVPDNLIWVLNETKDLSSAVKVFKWASLQKRFRHTTGTYYLIISRLGLAGHVQEMEAFCQNMVKDGCPGVEKALLALIDLFVENCRLSEAILVLLNMTSRGYTPTVETFNVVIGALVKNKKDFQDVLFVYKEMVKVGVLPTINTLNYLLEILFETNLVAYALNQFNKISKKGCSPNSKSFEILIKGLIAKNRVDEANTFLHEMFKSGCQPELSFYTCTIPLLCQLNKMEEGIRLFRLMKDSNFVPDSLIYAALIQCSCENLRLDDAISLLEEMAETGLMPPTNVLVDIINMYCKLRKLDKAVQFLEDRNIFETLPYNVLLEGFCSVGQLCMAKDLLGVMSERHIDDCGSWNILIRWVCEQEGIRKAYEVLGRMIISSFIPDDATYSALVVGNCKSSKCMDALELFYSACAKCWVLDSMSYSKLVESLCHVGKTLEATGVFHYMASKRCSLHHSIFNLLIKGMCDLRKVNEAVRLCQMAYHSGTSCNSSTYTAIMHGLLGTGQDKYLLAVFARMLVEGCNFDLEAYCILIQGISWPKRIKDCVMLFNMMVIEGLVPDSERLFNMMSCIANHFGLCMISCSIDNLISNYQVMDPAIYNLLINGLWKEGNKFKASQLLDLMLEKGWVPDARTHGLLIGPDVKEEIYREALANDNSTEQDTVSNILADGLQMTLCT